MTQDDKNLLKAIKNAMIIGIFYGGLMAIASGSLIMIVLPLVTCLVTLFNTGDLWMFVFLGASLTVIGLIVAATGYILALKCDIHPNGPPKLFKNIMLPVMAITVFLTLGIISLFTLLIYGWYVLY